MIGTSLSSSLSMSRPTRVSPITRLHKNDDSHDYVRMMTFLTYILTRKSRRHVYLKRRIIISLEHVIIGVPGMQLHTTLKHCRESLCLLHFVHSCSARAKRTLFLTRSARTSLYERTLRLSGF